MLWSIHEYYRNPLTQIEARLFRGKSKHEECYKVDRQEGTTLHCVSRKRYRGCVRSCTRRGKGTGLGPELERGGCLQFKFQVRVQKSLVRC